MTTKIFLSKKNIIIISSIIVAILIIGGIFIAVTLSNGISVSVGITDMLQLADRYLTEMNYEQAIIEFQKILEIDPKNVDAYIGLADVYISMGETEKAIETLNQAKNNIENKQRIENKLEEVNKVSEIEQQSAESVVNTITTTIITTPPQTTAATSETITSEFVTETTIVTDPSPETTTATITQAASIVPQLPENFAWVAGQEYTVDLSDISGERLNSGQFTDFDLDEYWENYMSYINKENYEPLLRELCYEINHPEFYDLYINAYQLGWNIGFNGMLMRGPYNTTAVCKLSNNGYYTQTNYTFDSFYSAFCENYTEECVKKIFCNEYGEAFMSLNGELWAVDRAIGGDLSVVHEEYELLSQADTKIVIRKISYHDDSYSFTYDPAKKEQYKTTYNDYNFVFTEKGWRIDTWVRRY